jgi:4-hydroxybenzoyl-CoA thioesterase
MLTITRSLRIEWGDCDPAGIVYFPRYFSFFDACTLALFDEVGLPKQTLLRKYDFVGMPVVEVSAKFMMPSKFGDDVRIDSSIREWKRSSFRVHHRLLKDTQLAVEGFETRVWVGKHPEKPGAMKSQPIPRELIDRFRSRAAAAR